MAWCGAAGPGGAGLGMARLGRATLGVAWTERTRSFGCSWSVSLLSVNASMAMWHDGGARPGRSRRDSARQCVAGLDSAWCGKAWWERIRSCGFWSASSIGGAPLWRCGMIVKLGGARLGMTGRGQATQGGARLGFKKSWELRLTESPRTAILVLVRVTPDGTGAKISDTSLEIGSDTKNAEIAHDLCAL